MTTGKSLLQTPDETTVPLLFTGGQWNRNSGICFHHAETKVEGREIRISIFTAPCNNYATGRDHTLHLKGLTRPEYDLIFIDPDGTRHPLGKLRR